MQSMMGKKYLYMTSLLSPSLRQIDCIECERRHAVRRDRYLWGTTTPFVIARSQRAGIRPTRWLAMTVAGPPIVRGDDHNYAFLSPLLAHPSRLVLLLAGGEAEQGIAPFVLEQMILGLQSAGKAGQSAVAAEHAMAGRDDRDRVAAVGGADRARRLGPADLARDLAIAAGLAERNRQQRGPHALLEIGAVEIERHRELLQPACEIGVQLFLRLVQEPVVRTALQRAEPHPPRIVVFPQHRGQTLVAGDQLQLAIRRGDRFVDVTACGHDEPPDDSCPLPLNLADGDAVRHPKPDKRAGRKEAINKSLANSFAKSFGRVGRDLHRRGSPGDQIDAFRQRVECNPYRNALRQTHPGKCRVDVGEQIVAGTPFTVVDAARDALDVSGQKRAFADQTHGRGVADLDSRQLGFLEIALDAKRVLVDQRGDAMADRHIGAGCRSMLVIRPLTEARTSERTRLSFARSRSATACS